MNFFFLFRNRSVGAISAQQIAKPTLCMAFKPFINSLSSLGRHFAFEYTPSHPCTRAAPISGHLKFSLRGRGAPGYDNEHQLRACRHILSFGDMTDRQYYAGGSSELIARGYISKLVFNMYCTSTSISSPSLHAVTADTDPWSCSALQWSSCSGDRPRRVPACYMLILILVSTTCRTSIMIIIISLQHP